MKIDNAKQRLGYTDEWLQFGIVTNEYVLDQFEEIETSEDKNAEHYRAWAFGQYLERKGNLTDLEVENIFKLRDKGPDNCDLTESRLHNLLFSNILTYEQLVQLPLDVWGQSKNYQLMNNDL